MKAVEIRNNIRLIKLEILIKNKNYKIVKKTLYINLINYVINYFCF